MGPALSARHAPQLPEGQAEGLPGATTSLVASRLVLLPPAPLLGVGFQASAAPVAVPDSGLASAGTEAAGHDSQRLDSVLGKARPGCEAQPSAG